MAKPRTLFFCQNCGYESAKWVGKCPSCEEWNSFVEEVIVKADKSKKIWQEDIVKSAPALLNEINNEKVRRFSSHNVELDRVLGGGIVPGSLVLIGGEPGIGKSTLMLQLSLKAPIKVLYVSGEESDHQIKLRADRISAEPRKTLGYLAKQTLTRSFFMLKP